MKKSNQASRLLQRERSCIMDRHKTALHIDRRKGTDRRRFLFAVHVPERRSEIDRRNRFDAQYESILDSQNLERSKAYH